MASASSPSIDSPARRRQWCARDRADALSPGAGADALHRGPGGEPGHRDRPHPRRRESGRWCGVPAGALPHRVLLPAGGCRAVRSRRARPWSHHRGPRGRGPGGQRGRHRVALRAACARRLPQHRRRARRGRPDRGPLPQDAHPGRSALLREVLLHARRPGLRRGRHPRRPDRHAGVLGPVVSRGRAPDGPRRAPTSSSTRRRSAGIRRRRRSSASASSTPGRRSNGHMRSPTASTSPRSTASDTRAPPTQVSNSGARRSSPIRSAS